MDTRQKILFVCKKKDENDLKYCPDLVKGLFNWSVETEMINDTTRMRILLYVQDSEIPDEDLIYQMQQAVSAEVERKQKFGINTKKSVNEVSVTQKQEKATDTRATEKPKEFSQQFMLCEVRLLPCSLNCNGLRTANMT